VIFDKKSIEVHKFWLAQPMRADGDALGERMVKFKGRKLGERGQSMVEFAFGVPVLLLALIGVVMMGVAFNNQIALTFAAGIGAQQLSISRGKPQTRAVWLAQRSKMQRRPSIRRISNSRLSWAETRIRGPVRHCLKRHALLMGTRALARHWCRPKPPR